MPQVDVLILTWNQYAFTRNCLRSLQAVEYPNMRVILVDNGSTDETLAAVREEFPSVEVWENRGNLGFALGNNRGMVRALEEGADFILLLNNDTTVAPDMLALLIETMQADERLGVLGPLMLEMDALETVWNAGNRVDWRNGYVEGLRSGLEVDAISADLTPVDYITGCGMLLRSKMLKQIGLFDERFFAYYEEADLCQRAVQHGWRVACQPQAHLWHHVSATFGTTSPVITYYLHRNRLLFLAKHLRGYARLRAMMISARHTLQRATYQAEPHKAAVRHALRDALFSRWGRYARA